jgi:hypothetical protein
MSDLVVCCGCDRHVRPSEPACPFCGASRAAGHRAEAPPAAVRGLSRARLYAVHAAMVTGVAAGSATACGTNMTATTDAASEANVTPPPQDASASEDLGHFGGDDVALFPIDVQDVATIDRGAPDAAPSAGTDATVSDASDAAEGGAVVDVVPDHWMIVPPYGCVFPLGCRQITV